SAAAAISLWIRTQLLQSRVQPDTVTGAMANATIIDVAAQAGVSIKTVSRVINNVTTVKPAIRARVARAIEKLDYHPKPSARGLGANRSDLLGLPNDLWGAYYP